VGTHNVDPGREPGLGKRESGSPALREALWADWELYRFALEKFAR